MTSTNAESGGLTVNPIEVVEEIVASHDWPFDRPGDEELTVSVAGSWCEYHLRFSWEESHQALQLVCGLDLRIPDAKRQGMYELLGLINEQMLIGHFDFWSGPGLVLFRHEVLLRDAQGATSGQCEDLIEAAIVACDRIYPCLQFVLWGGKSPRDAVRLAMLETHGEA